CERANASTTEAAGLSATIASIPSSLARTPIWTMVSPPEFSSAALQLIPALAARPRSSSFLLTTTSTFRGSVFARAIAGLLRGFKLSGSVEVFAEDRHPLHGRWAFGMAHSEPQPVRCQQLETSHQVCGLAPPEARTETWCRGTRESYLLRSVAMRKMKAGLLQRPRWPFTRSPLEVDSMPVGLAQPREPRPEFLVEDRHLAVEHQ